MKCKPGDLAFIIYSTYPENIGLVVEVIQLYSSEYWIVRLVNPPPNAKGYNTETGTVVPISSDLDLIIQDDCLQPIRPAPNDQTVETTLKALC